MANKKTSLMKDKDFLIGCALSILAVALGIFLVSVHSLIAPFKNKAPTVTAATSEIPKRFSQEAIPKSELQSAISSISETTAVSKVVSGKISDGILRPQNCITQSERIATSSYSAIAADLISGAFELDVTCDKYETKNKLTETTYENCVFDRETHKLVDQQKCLSSTVLYRAQVIDELTKNRDDFRSMSTALLANKFIAHVLTANTQTFDSQTIQIADALVSAQPELPAAAKAAVLARAPAVFEAGSLTPEGFDEAIAHAREVAPKDAELVELELLHKLKQGDLHASDRFVTDNPEQAIGYYARARQRRAANDRPGMLADLTAAVRLNPTENRFKETLAKATSSRENAEEIFKMNLNVNFEEL